MTRIRFAVVLTCLCLGWANGRGFLSDLTGGKTADDTVEEYDKPCESVKVMPRIVGGAEVQSKNSAPYIAAIGERLSNGSISWFCGGSIVSKWHILTAAHCMATRKIDVVRVGSLSLKRDTSQGDIQVSETIIHPRYKSPASYHDVAIIKLRKKMEFAKNIRPICLAEKTADYAGKKAKVVGWGAEEVGGDGSPRLQQVEVQIVGNNPCDKAYQNSTVSERTFPMGVSSGQLCAGSPKGGKDACQGDSGGPLVLADNEGTTRQIGVVSTGAGCGAKVYPGVYARVSTYHDWIQQQVKGESSTVKPKTRGRGRS